MTSITRLVRWFLHPFSRKCYKRWLEDDRRRQFTALHYPIFDLSLATLIAAVVFHGTFFSLGALALGIVCFWIWSTRCLLAIGSLRFDAIDRSNLQDFEKKIETEFPSLASFLAAEGGRNVLKPLIARGDTMRLLREIAENQPVFVAAALPGLLKRARGRDEMGLLHLLLGLSEQDDAFFIDLKEIARRRMLVRLFDFLDKKWFAAMEQENAPKVAP